MPGNIGVVDTKGIYDSVVSALKTHEALRTAQQVQQATDAELTLATDKAKTETGLLSPEAEARKAKAGLLASQSTEGLRAVTPGVNADIAKANLLSSQSTEGLRAVKPKVEADIAKAGAEKTEADIMSDPEFKKELLRRKHMSPTERLRQNAIEVLADPNASEVERKAAEIYLGERAKAQAPSYGTAVTSDGRVIIADRRAPGLFDPASGTGMGSMAGGVPSGAPAAAPATGTSAPATPPTATPAPAPAQVPAPMTPAAVQAVEQDKRWMGISPQEKLNAAEITQVKGKWLEKLPALENSVRTLTSNVEQGERDLAEAERIIKGVPDGEQDVGAKLLSLLPVTGFGSGVASNIRGTPAYDLREKLNTVGTNIFTGALAEMRANSPTGGALGSVTDVEGEKFSKILGSLDPGQSKEALLKNIETVRQARRQTLRNLQDSVVLYKDRLGGFGGAPTAAATTPSAPAATAKLTIDDLVKMYATPKAP